jgi:hypothetical protein
MKYLKMLGLAAVAAGALMAFVGAGTASATTIEVKGVPQNQSVTILASLHANTSAILKDEFGTTTDTCTTSEVHLETTSPFTKPHEEEIDGKVGTLKFGGCSHTTHVLKNGLIYLKWETGTTHGIVTSSGAEVTVNSTFFGASAICKTGTGTQIGTLTGATSAQNPTAHATIHVNATISCGILGNSKWTGAYSVTTPTDLGVIE